MKEQTVKGKLYLFYRARCKGITVLHGVKATNVDNILKKRGWPNNFALKRYEFKPNQKHA